jgi:hypothetical protein
MLDDSAATKTLSVLPKAFQTPVYKLFKGRETEIMRRERE